MNLLNNLLVDYFSIPVKPQPAKKVKVWFYQYEGQQKQQIVKDSGMWWFNASNGGGIGCPTLAEAKNDLTLIYKAKVWSERI